MNCKKADYNGEDKHKIQSERRESFRVIRQSAVHSRQSADRSVQLNDQNPNSPIILSIQFNFSEYLYNFDRWMQLKHTECVIYYLAYSQSLFAQ
jgi:hypothetical protein